MKKLISVLLVLCVAVGSLTAAVYAVPEPSAQVDVDEFSDLLSDTVSEYGLIADDVDASFEEYESCRIVVKSSAKVDSMGASKVIEAFDGMTVFQYATAEETKTAFEYFTSLDCVDFAEIDKIVTVSTDSYPYETKDSYLSWGSEYVGFGELNNYIVENQLELAPVYVAVLDTGVNHNHERLIGRVEPTGYNISPTGEADSSMDDNGHGSGVAGVIVSNTFSNVIIRPYKCFNSEGESSNFLIATAIRKAVDDGNAIINMSFSNLEDGDFINFALDYAKENTDPIMIAAIGNNGIDAESLMPMPATSDYVIAVSAMSKDGGKLDSSNYNKKYVELTAPGDRIRTTFKGNKTLVMMSGTSLAVPFVVSVAAAAKSLYPSAGTDTVRRLMNETAIPLFTDPGNRGYFGNGMVYAMGVLEGTEGIEPLCESAKAPVFNCKSGLYNDSVRIEIESEEGARIYYTTDGTVPTEASNLYEDAITATKGTNFLAAAYVDGKAKSPVSTASYRILETASESFLSVDDNGIITAISGEHFDITVPQTMLSTSGKTVTVKGVGESAFNDYGYLRHIELPETVTDIAPYAFYNCTNLEYAEFCGAETIGDYAFYNCVHLKNFSPDGVQYIGDYAFYGLGSQTDSSVILHLKNLEHLGEHAFYSSCATHFYAPLLASALGDSVFEGSAKLEEVYAPGTNAIGANAFSGCANMTSAAFDNAISVGDGAFYGCEKISTLSLSSAQSLGDAALHGCTSLGYFSLDAVKSIYLDSFRDVLPGITELYLPELEIIHGVEGGMLPSAIESFYAPKLKNIPANTFKGNGNLCDVVLGSVESIGDYAFYECKALAKIDLSTVKSIGDYAFYNCTALNEPDITALEYLGSYTFYNCSKLKYIYMPELLEAGGFSFYGVKYSYLIAPKLVKADRRMLASNDNSFVSKVIDLSSLESITFYNFFSTKCKYIILSSLKTGDFYVGGSAYIPDTFTGTAYAGRPDELYVAPHSDTEKGNSFMPAEAQSHQTLFAGIYGPNVTYQWYSSTNGSRTDSVSTPIAGANSPELFLLTAPDAPYYYCKVTSDFNGKIMTAYTSSVKNASYLNGEQRADYSAVLAAIESVPADLRLYTDASVSALDRAIDTVYYNCTSANQRMADSYASSVLNAISGLKYKNGDYSAVEAQLALVPEDMNLYMPLTAAAVEYAVANVVENLDCRSQKRIDCMALMLAEKLGKLVYKKADYSELEKTLANVPEDMRLYTKETASAVQTVLDSIDFELNITRQETVDGYTEALNDALGELVPNAANFTDLLEALDSVPQDLNLYTDESVRAVNEILTAIENELDTTDYAQVEEYTLALSEAVRNLEYKKADYSKVDEALSAVPGDLSLYTDESKKELETALASVESELDITEQETVDGYALAITEAVNKLVLKDADYTLVEAALSAVPQDISLYTAQSVANLKNAVNAVEYGLDITKQMTVDGYAEAINAAVAALEYDKVLIKPTVILNAQNKFVLKSASVFDIYYTLDGTEPTAENGKRYTAPIDLSQRNVTLIKAACFIDGEAVSDTTVYRMTSFVNLTVRCGKTVKATADYNGKIIWKSNNPSVATVDANGFITGVAKGEAGIVAKFESGKRIIFNVTVEYTFWQSILDFFMRLFRII